LRNEASFDLGWQIVSRNEARLIGDLAARANRLLTRAAPFKANECVEGFVEGALVGCVVAEEERETFFVDSVSREAFVLKAEGALGEPPGLRHFVNKHLFGRIGGLVLGEQGFKE
jgi:hypothetical protein